MYKKLKSNFQIKTQEDYQLNFGSSVLIVQEDHILFTITKPKSWKYDEKAKMYTVLFSGVGGGVENDETPLECLRRELLEEIGLSIDDLQFYKPKETMKITFNDEKKPISFDEEDIDIVGNPFYILERLLPLRKDVKSDKQGSSLHLVVYLAFVDSSYSFMAKEADIPGLLMVRKDLLPKLLQGGILIEDEVNPEGIKIIKNHESKIPLPEKFMLKPQFTPLGLKILNVNPFDINERRITNE